jgi:hypothetical protein
MKKSEKTIFTDNEIIFENQIWEISIFPNLSEITISNGNRIFYGCPTKCKTKIFYDNTNFPKYIANEAIKAIQKININSIYNN